MTGKMIRQILPRKIFCYSLQPKHLQPFFLILLALLLPLHSYSQVEFDSHKIIVKLKPRASMLQRKAADMRMARLKQMRPVKRDIVSHTRPLAGGIERIFVAEIGDGENLEAVLKELAANPDVEYAERDYIMHVDEAGRASATFAPRLPLEPDDYFFNWQWGLKNTGQTNNGTPGMDVNAVNAWDITTGDPRTILAILDTGIIQYSPEFEGRVLPGYNFVNGDNNTTDDDTKSPGHGTKMAGIAAATGGNSILIAGMNWKCRILPVKILDSSGSGSTSNMIQGVTYAVDHGAKIISISAGVRDLPQDAISTLQAVVDYAISNDSVIVASIGNSNVEFPTQYPAGLRGVFAIGAINSRGQRAAPYSCPGSSLSAGSNYGNHISFVAPGDQIISLNYNDPGTLAERPGCGTSDAVPFVSGLISLMFGVNPLLTYDQVYEALKAGARDQIGFPTEDTPGWDKYYGWGLIDARRTLEAVPPVGRTYFAQMAVGGGTTTTFTLVNTGAEAASGNLVLTANNGTPLTVVFSSPGRIDSTASSYPVRIPSGGTLTLTASSADAGAPTVSGWGLVESSGGSLSGVATFQLADRNKLTTIAGVLSSTPTATATIPVSDDNSLGDQSYSTGYAVVNPGTEDIYVGITLLNQDGSFSRTIAPAELNPLKPGYHFARFLYQDLNDDRFSFQGTMVLSERTGKPFAVVGLVMNQKLYTAVPVIPAVPDGTTKNTFAHVVVGGGFTTVFSFVNPGGVPASGILTLAGEGGGPMNVSFLQPGGTTVSGASYPVDVPAGGTRLVEARSLNAGDPIQVGWARIESPGEALQGVATFQLKVDDRMKTIVGVLSSAATNAATIPISDDISVGPGAGRSTGYAVANPGSEDVNITVTILNADGSTQRTISPVLLNPLRAGSKAARFLWEDLSDPLYKFEGSMVLTEKTGKSFSVVALLMNQQLFTAVPVIPARAPVR